MFVIILTLSQSVRVSLTSSYSNFCCFFLFSAEIFTFQEKSLLFHLLLQMLLFIDSRLSNSG